MSRLETVLVGGSLVCTVKSDCILKCARNVMVQMDWSCAVQAWLGAYVNLFSLYRGLHDAD